MNDKEIDVKYLKKIVMESSRFNSLKYTQVSRVGRIALYHVTMPKNSIDVGYEIFIVPYYKNTKNRIVEKYPKELAFGKTAFSSATLKGAYLIFDSLIDGEI